nr:hypothetical protein CFP56_75730 [Quercus suber]
MADELEELWKKLTFTEEEDTGIELDSGSTSAARKLGKYCVVMKILSQRSINVDALRKNLRMLWKPNKGIQIAELEEDLFLVEFGDEKDKKKVLDMCPWSYEKQLVLLQEFEGKLTPKEIEVKWAPFWVQIYNLPLNSRTRETGWAIGSCLGSVLDVDVTDSGVQWGKCLRVRVSIDITKCGLLNHSLRECSERQASGDKDGASHLQYGAWLRGEPMRRGGREVVAQGARREATESKGAPEVSSTAPAEQRNTVKERNMVKECPEERGGHVDDKSNQEGSQSIGDVGVVTSVKPMPDVLAENGKVKELVGKKEEKEAALGRVGEEKLAAKTDFTEGMQWETALGQRSQLISEGNLAPKNEVKMKVIGPVEENPIPGPLAMCYDEKTGWTSETLGPASRHWKRLAREINKGVVQESISPSNPKRVGPTPLQELDPNSVCQKRRKGKNVGDEETNGKKNRVGGVAVAAEQHRRAK